MHHNIERGTGEARSNNQESEKRKRSYWHGYVISHSLFSLFTSSLRFLSIRESSYLYSLCFSCLLCEIDIAHVLDVDGRRVKVVDEIRQPLLQWYFNGSLTVWLERIWQTVPIKVQHSCQLLSPKLKLLCNSLDWHWIHPKVKVVNVADARAGKLYIAQKNASRAKDGWRKICTLFSGFPLAVMT